MQNNQNSIIIDRIEKIARKVYRGHKNAVVMLINDLEEFFEMNNNNIDRMTTDEFDSYLKNICKEGI